MMTKLGKLYDLAHDVGEANDLARARPELVRELARTWDDWDARNVSPFWHGSPTEDPTAPARPALAKPPGSPP